METEFCKIAPIFPQTVLTNQSAVFFKALSPEGYFSDTDALPPLFKRGKRIENDTIPETPSIYKIDINYKLYICK